MSKKEIIKIPIKRTNNKLNEENKLEITHEDDAIKYGKSLGWRSHRYAIPGVMGPPDRIFLKNNRVFFIEFKRLGKELRPKQLAKCMELRLQGFIVCSSDNIIRSKSIIMSVNDFYNDFDSSSDLFFNICPEFEKLK